MEGRDQQALSPFAQAEEEERQELDARAQEILAEIEAERRAFVTKDSGKRQEFSTGMVRDTQEGKPRFDLLFPKGIGYADQILTRFAGLMERGAQKYAERNWELAHTQEELDRARGSALRHLIQWYTGETDEDHAAGVMFNLMAAETIRLKMAAEAADRFNCTGQLPAAEEHAPLDGFYEYPTHIAGQFIGICPECRV